MFQLGLIGHKIIALRLLPKALEAGIVDEHVWGAGSIGSVFKIEVAPVQVQRVAIRIERERGKGSVIMVYDQSSVGRLEKCFHQWPRRQEWIEDHHGEAGADIKQNHSQHCRHERTYTDPTSSPKYGSEQRERTEFQPIT